MKADYRTEEQEAAAVPRFVAPGIRPAVSSQMAPNGGASEQRSLKIAKDALRVIYDEKDRLDRIGNCAFTLASECSVVHTGSPILMSFSGFEEKPFFHNTGDGKFVEIGGALGLGVPYDGRGLEAADFEGCGAVDLVLKNAYKPALNYFRNEVGNDRKMLTLRPRSKGKNRFAVGARALLETEARKQLQEVECGGSFLSCGPQELYFGLGEAKGAKKISITWPSGKTTVLADVPSGIVTVTEGEEGWKHEPYRKRSPKPPVEVARPLRRGDSVSSLKLESLSGAAPPPSFKDAWSVLDVWSARCTSCVGQLPNYKELAAAAQSRGAAFVPVNVDEDPAKAAQLAKGLDPKLAVFRAPGSLSLLVNPHEPLVPATIVIGPDGIVRARHTGVLSPSELRALLDEAKR